MIRQLKIENPKWLGFRPTCWRERIGFDQMTAEKNTEIVEYRGPGEVT